MKLIWASDIHLNFLKDKQRAEFYSDLKGDAVVISGDIAESKDVVQMIGEIQEATSLPVYFVLGNHDFYESSVTAVKRSVKSLGWLGGTPEVPLSASTVLLGVDGWGDCRYGDFENSRITMSDWRWIDELRIAHGRGMDRLKEVLQYLAGKDAALLKRRVKAAIKKGYSNIIIVTHVPPFEEACVPNSDGLPFYASKCLGEAILPIAKKNPEVDFLWLSGHTHNRATYSPTDNLTVKVAKSGYYYPQVEEVFNVE